MQQSNVVETLIGAAVVAVAVLFVVFAYSSTGSASLSSTYPLSAQLPKVDGLSVGTDVRLAGVKIGSVSKLDLDPKTYQVHVAMTVRDTIKVPDDSSLVVTSSGVLGSQYLSVTPGGSDTMLKPGESFANVQGSVDLMGLVGRFVGGGNTQSQQPAPATP